MSKKTYCPPQLRLLELQPEDPLFAISNAEEFTDEDYSNHFDELL